MAINSLRSDEGRLLLTLDSIDTVLPQSTTYTFFNMYFSILNNNVGIYSGCTEVKYKPK